MSENIEKGFIEGERHNFSSLTIDHMYLNFFTNEAAEKLPSAVHFADENLNHGKGREFEIMVSPFTMKIVSTFMTNER